MASTQSRLQGKIVLITGASSGIGRSTALLFASHGSHLVGPVPYNYIVLFIDSLVISVLGARRVEKLKDLTTEIEKNYPSVKVHIYQLDVRSNESVEKFVQNIPKEFSEIDVLVNNAGLALGVKHTHENDLDQMNQMLDTNVKGIFYMIKAIVPGMIERKKPGSTIINISSVAGLEGYPGGSAYCASKHAVQGLTMAMRKELVATPIRVASICPGLCNETEFSLVRLGNQEAAQKVYQGIEPLKPEDVADTIVYVASRPPHVQITDIVMYPTNQAAPTVVHRNT